ncbi:MAG: AgmX/PglI C-terminal domain-containing protein [Bdellovibrionaceae bacterium]|nr:AgmX/PglI C-terminal domain-containing protein [Pseudobdellovibrionaceae bacterium]NUM59230.1 AgmX/PglI C-terminal domain-containing protein [Pseudobdellovibrionaceae bacterium]
MKTLIVEQHLQNGQTKVWKLKSDKSYYTFGSQRIADLVSIDPSLASWECAFEFDSKGWKLIDLNPENFEKNIYPTHFINEPITLVRKNSKLILKPIERSVTINEFQLTPNVSNNGKNYQIFQIYYFDQLVETKILPSGKKFITNSMPQRRTFESIPSSSWHIQKINDYTIKQKSIVFESPKNLAKVQWTEFLEKSDQRSFFALFLVGIFLFTFIYSLPRSQKYLPTNSKRAIASEVIMKLEPKKVQPKEKKKEVAQKIDPETIKETSKSIETKPADNKLTKVAGLLKNVNTQRISTLLGKVSSQGQKSKNIILSDGITAGSASSGRALSALGKIDKAGGDWTSEAQGKNFKISTKGVGGGNSISGMGALKAGKVGQGGVGLIEDESEIVGGLDREEIANYIKTQLGQILYCYERQLSANKELFGKVSVKFTISGNGKVEAQSINDTSLKNSQVESCMLNKISAWKFPTPKGGTKVIVTYPFMFKSTN